MPPGPSTPVGVDNGLGAVRRPAGEIADLAADCGHDLTWLGRTVVDVTRRHEGRQRDDEE
jgi:hypothetical protein